MGKLEGYKIAMKNYPLSLFFLFVALAVTTSFHPPRPMPAATVVQFSSPGDEANEIIHDIIAVIGLKPNFEVRTADIPNAAALTYNGKRYIAYNPQFISKLNAAAGNKWASVSVLAHEIGHHLNGHTLTNKGSKPPLELEADEFSGFVLQKMGATLQQAQVAMKLAASYKQSLTHPGQRDRLLAIEKGWTNAGGAVKDMAKYSKPATSSKPRSVSAQGRAAPANPAREEMNKEQAENSTAVLDPKFILASLDFVSDRSAANYYVTTRFNVVKLLNGQLFLLGKMLRTNSKEYPFVLKSDNSASLYVNRNGRIVTANKKLAGFLRNE